MAISFFEKGEAQPFLTLQRNKIHKNFRLIADDSYVQLEDNAFDLQAKEKTIESHTSIDEKMDIPSFDKKQLIDFYVDVVGHRFSFSNNALTFRYSEVSDFIPSYEVHVLLNTTDVTIGGNKFESTLQKSHTLWTTNNCLQFTIHENVQKVELVNNQVEPDLFVHLGYNLNSLRIHGNNFHRIAFDPFKIPDQSNAVLWSDLANAHVGLATGDFGITKTYYSATEDEIGDRLSFRELLKFYKKFYDEYKSAGDIQSSNQVYIKIKDLETTELRSSYRNDPSFNLWFRVKLNQLLKFYTAYGTDPAQALVASFWIIFVFAIFYFFFPSSWDIASKSRLLQDFKDFIEKNEKGYVKPFFKMTGGFTLSLLNALTLSLNAFVTLGFGEIPTKGAAKYITVVQGFLGWFLLSIFTVSLVSQLLF